MPEEIVQPKISLPWDARKVITFWEDPAFPANFATNGLEANFNVYVSSSDFYDLMDSYNSALTQLSELRAASEYAYKQMNANGVFDAEAWSASVTGLGDALAKSQTSPASAVKGG